MLPKSLLLPVVVVVAALAIALLILFGLGAPDVPAKPAAESPKSEPKRRPGPLQEGGGFGVDTAFTPSATTRESTTVVEEATESSPGEEMLAEVPMQPWEEAINRILESDKENQQVATQLLGLLPTLPPDGQVEAVQHMVNLTDDESYQNAAAMLLNPATAENVAEVIYSDVLNRPNTVKLPVMVSILRTPGHRLRDETLSTLQIFLGEDLGDNPEAWNAAVQNYLAKEAQEAAAAELEAPTAQ
jgi:uncharacterized protein YdbL (DUF1318 family)